MRQIGSGWVDGVLTFSLKTASPAIRVSVWWKSKKGDKFEVSDFEVERGEVSFTIDTVEYFLKKYPDSEFFFLAGSDACSELDSWQDVERIFELITFVIAVRPGWQFSGIYADRVKRLDMSQIDISSTTIRSNVKVGKSINRLVPDDVINFIYENNLYKSVSPWLFPN